MAPSVEVSKAPQDFVSASAKVERDGQVREELKETQSFPVGPGEKLYFYQQHFSGPGLDFDIPTAAAVIGYIKEMDDVYGDNASDAPSDRVTEFFSGADNINDGYVWLVPVYTETKAEAATSFDILIRSRPIEGLKNLAKGPDGDYRYIRAVHDTDNNESAIMLTLLRSNEPLSSGEVLSRLGYVWDGGYRNIDEKRGGSFLYFAWGTFKY
ncbi:hypothetical protein F5Y13DRAFT_191167 [Hypoxylon sp. FL1857]|nr:hypothetical protein F5Y13DRAFT_191167 [Hypoxylon sp. FL1857]